MKKALSLLVAVVLLVSMSASTVFAGRGGCHGSARHTSVCDIYDCVTTGVHWHAGNSYTAHYYGDGHDYHDYCGFDSCDTQGYHSHEDEYYFGHCGNGRLWSRNIER